MLGLLIYCLPSSPSFISKFRFLKPVSQDCLFLKTRNKTSPVCLAARQTLSSPVPRGGLGRRGGACKAGGGRPTGFPPSRGTLWARSRVYPGPRWPGGPPGAPRPRRRRTVPGPGWPGGGFLGRRAVRVGCRGVRWCLYLPPPPIRLRSEPRDPPRVGLEVLFGFEWLLSKFGLSSSQSNQSGLTRV